MSVLPPPEPLTQGSHESPSRGRRRSKSLGQVLTPALAVSTLNPAARVAVLEFLEFCSCEVEIPIIVLSEAYSLSIPGTHEPAYMLRNSGQQGHSDACQAGLAWEKLEFIPFT